MRLVSKNVLFYLFINYNLFAFKEHPLCLHTTFPELLPMFVAFLNAVSGMSLKACVPELWMLLLTQNGVLPLPILLFKVARCEIR